jgi:N-methylhydantoinase A
VYLAGHGLAPVPVWRLAAIPVEEAMDGPAVVETATTTVVIDAGARFRRRATGTLHIAPGAAVAEGGEAWTASAWRS